MLNIGRDRMLSAVSALKTSVINQDPKTLAEILRKFVHAGSQTHVIYKEDIRVYVFDKDKTEFHAEKTSVEAKMRLMGIAGSKFFDRIYYLGLSAKDRPDVNYVAYSEDKHKDIVYGPYDDPGLITNYIFYVYFYILIRAHAPTTAAAYAGQTAPKFLSAVMAITEPPIVIAKYLSSFDLNKIDPQWVIHIPMTPLGKEAQTRFGLGVAGYRVCSVFNFYKPDLPLDEPTKQAYEVARSFLGSGLSWEFHPSTRDPNVLTKYGNINKNCNNLILICYKEETIKKMVTARKLNAFPVHDPSHLNYETWTELYSPKTFIFNSRSTV